MLTRVFSLALLVAAVGADTVSIHKVDYPESGFCGEEENVTKSNLNPHYFFPMHFGGFHEGPCSDEGYTHFEKKVVVAMHPVPGVHHNLTFFLYSKPGRQSPAAESTELPASVQQISTQVMEFVDSSRKNKKVSAKVCVPEGDGTWPLYIFGHGFDCSPDDYAYFCKVAVTVLPFSTNFTFVDFNTKSLAEDAAFLSSEIPQLAKQGTNLFTGKLNGAIAFGGHSMGGGTSVLAAGQPNAAVGMALFAPGLYTVPPANPYLKDVKVPALIVSGSDDCGPNQLPKEAQPAFDGMASEKKVLVSLKGANHCQWAAPTKGEIGVCSMPFFKECALIDADSQHSLGVELAAAFFKGLSGEQGWESFEQMLAQGESSGKWTYFSSKTSPSTKKLHNDCPCKKTDLVV